MGLIDRNSFQGYNVSGDRVDFGEMSDVEDDISNNTLTLFATLDPTDDEFYRIGQGDEATQEYARGRLQMTLDDGSGTKIDDSSIIEVVELSGQNNVRRVIKRGKYGQFKQGSGGSSSEPLPEQGAVITSPKKIGLRAQAGGASSFNVNTGSSNSELRLDVVRGEE